MYCNLLTVTLKHNTAAAATTAVVTVQTAGKLHHWHVSMSSKVTTDILLIEAFAQQNCATAVIMGCSSVRLDSSGSFTSDQLTA
jgi:hypothetical protein